MGGGAGLGAALIEELEDAFSEGGFFFLMGTVRGCDEPGPLNGNGSSGAAQLGRAHKDFDRCHGTNSKAEIETGRSGDNWGPTANGDLERMRREAVRKCRGRPLRIDSGTLRMRSQGRVTT